MVMDSQTVRAANSVPATITSLDVGRQSPGRKRGIATDVIGLIIGSERGESLSNAL
ncbi:hypothetical protein ABIA35_000319 [Catenulispora sp. MAP12-49]